MRRITIGAMALVVAFPAAKDAMGQGSVEGDCAALVALYDATDGPNWDDNTGWGRNWLW